VGKIDDPEQPEDDRQADRDQDVQKPKHEAVRELRQDSVDHRDRPSGEDCDVAETASPGKLMAFSPATRQTYAGCRNPEDQEPYETACAGTAAWTIRSLPFRRSAVIADKHAEC